METGKTENLAGFDKSGSSIGINAGAEEVGKVIGTYHIQAVGPVEHLRERYCELRDLIDELKKKGSNFAIQMKEFLEIPIEPKWAAEAPNVVTTVGKNELLDKGLAGSAYTAAYYMGLISLTGWTSIPVVGDTMASHTTWAEDQNYTQGARPTATPWNAAAAGSKALTSALVFSMNATTTVKGCFLTTIATKGGTTGILYSAGTFTGGDKALNNGDTLNVSYTATLT